MVEVDLLKIVQPLQPKITFLVGNQNAPVPEHVFCYVTNLGSNDVGMGEISNIDNTETINSIIRYTISFTYHGTIQADPAKYSRQLQRYLRSSDFVNKLTEKGYSLWRVNNIINAPVLKGVDIYTSSTLDIILATNESDQYEVDVIDVVNINGDLGQFDYQHEVEIK